MLNAQCNTAVKATFIVNQILEVNCCILSPLLCESLFSIVSVSNIVMWDVGITYYLLFLEQCLAGCAKVFIKSISFFCITLNKETFKFVYTFLLFKARNFQILNTTNHSKGRCFKNLKIRTKNAHYFRS